jgi:hypothetical protein
MRAVDLPLPEHRYLPGVNERPDDAFFAAVKAEVPKETKDGTSVDNIAWHYGLRLLNAGFYWEAHEVLEPVWHNAAPNSRERHLVKAVIHLANGLLKTIMGRDRAGLRLATLCREALSGAFPDGQGRLMGVGGADVFDAADRLAAGQVDVQIEAYYEI